MPSKISAVALHIDTFRRIMSAVKYVERQRARKARPRSKARQAT